MTEPRYPFTAFSFAVEIYPQEGRQPLVSAAFSECDGLEMTHEVKTIREGGSNQRQIRLNGAMSFGSLVLKRGMTEDFGLWRWFQACMDDPRLRAGAEVVVMAADNTTPRARFRLSRCVPVKLKAPALNARDGQVAIEELQIAYETLQVALPAPDTRAS